MDGGLKEVNQVFFFSLSFLLVMRLHCAKGSPWYPLSQTQIGIWFRTLHVAWMPHSPGQGSRHFWLLHASSVGQSLLKTHSGWQFGGLPIILGWQEQLQRSPCLLGGLEYGPQGLGLQGSSSTTGSIARTCIVLKSTSNIDIVYLRRGFCLHAVKGSPM